MGNKLNTEIQDNIPRTPKKRSPNQHQYYLSNKSKSAQKDGLYAEERLFENYDSKYLKQN